MKRIFILIALFAVNISWAQGKFTLHKYNSFIGNEFLQRVIKTHPHVDAKYIHAYGKLVQKLIRKGKAHACVAYRDGDFVAQAVLVPQIKNKYLRQELLALAPDAITDENSIQKFTEILQTEFPNAEGLACCFPKDQLKGFEPLLRKTGYKPNPEIAEYESVLIEYYNDDFADHLWFSHDFKEMKSKHLRWSFKLQMLRSIESDF